MAIESLIEAQEGVRAHRGIGPGTDRESTPLEAHHVAVPGGRWALWRPFVLRSAGFPAERVLGLGAEDLAAATERWLDLEMRAADRREEVVQRVNHAADGLRQAGHWDDKSRRKPLLKALSVLRKGKYPEPWEADAESHLESLRSAEAERDAERRRVADLFRQAQARTSLHIQEIVRWGCFREAVTWQNRGAVHTAFQALQRLADPARSRGSQQRQHEEMVASYLQRYCVKNDTIGFFGPVAWGAVTESGEDAEPGMEVRFGESDLAVRTVYFENWAIDTLAKTLARRVGIRPWLLPRLRSSLFMAGRTVHRVGAPMELSALDAAVVAACDGERNAFEVAAKLRQDPEHADRSDEEIQRRLLALVKKRLLTWGLEIPLELHPEKTLRRLLERIGDIGLRSESLAALDRLEAARQRVAAAAGDDEALDAALRGLEETFSELTGQSARRLHGQTYAGRGLVYEDCRRDLEVRMGSAILDRLGPPMTAVLEGARWLAGEVAQRMRGRMLGVWERLVQGGQETSINSSTFYGQVMSEVFLKRETDPIFVAAEAEYQRRWAEVLELDPSSTEHRVTRSADEVLARVRRVFGDPEPAWQLTRHFSPDVMIAARDVDAIQRGEYLAVLGEVHNGNTIFSSCFVAQHPDVGSLMENLRRDVVSEPVVVPFFIKENWMQRVNMTLHIPEFLRYELTDAPPGSEVSCDVLPAAGVVVEKADHGLIARRRDGRVIFDPIELFCGALNQVVSGMINHILGGRGHLPRVEIGTLAVSRERWTFGFEDLPFADESDPEERFLGVHRWVRCHRIPRFCFYKVSSERKPVYVDFASPIYVDLFVKMIRDLRRAEPENGRLGLSEMLPDFERTWLSNGSHRYTCELRMVALDRDEAQRANSRPVS